LEGFDTDEICPRCGESATAHTAVYSNVWSSQSDFPIKKVLERLLCPDGAGRIRL
jgi:hypothetical protein